MKGLMMTEDEQQKLELEELARMEIEEFGIEGAKRLRNENLEILRDFDVENFNNLETEDPNIVDFEHISQQSFIEHRKNYLSQIPKLSVKVPRNFGVHNFYTLCLTNGTTFYVLAAVIAHFNGFFSISQRPLQFMFFTVLSLIFLWFTFLEYLLLTRGNLINSQLVDKRDGRRNSYHHVFDFLHMDGEKHDIHFHSRIEDLVIGSLYPILVLDMMPDRMILLKSIQHKYTLNKEGDWKHASNPFFFHHISLIVWSMAMIYLFSSRDIQMLLR